MIRKLRIKFIAVTMASIGCLFLLILLVINLFMNLSSRQQGYRTLEDFAQQISSPAPEFDKTMDSPDMLSPDADDAQNIPPSDTDDDLNTLPPDTDGTPELSQPTAHSHPAPEQGSPDAFRIFSVVCDSDGNISKFNYNHDTDLTEDTIQSLFSSVSKKGLSEDKTHGVVQTRYLYLSQHTGDTWTVYFLDYSVEHSMVYRLFWLCLLVGMIGMCLLFAAVFFLSGWIVKPVERTFENQKNFIADASHELKTPLTIINANAEVLQNSLGENKWLQHILEQTNRMNLLIRDLLDLARLDSAPKAIAFSDFDFSRAVTASALSFESLAFETHKTYRIEIADGVHCTGNEGAIRQLVTILLDNAFKYSEAGAQITISLSRKGDKKILSVLNTGRGISKEDQKHIFERFYRSDNSRSRESGSTGGYGLGLAIAASIVSSHSGQISVKSDEVSYTQITAVL